MKTDRKKKTANRTYGKHSLGMRALLVIMTLIMALGSPVSMIAAYAEDSSSDGKAAIDPAVIINTEPAGESDDSDKTALQTDAEGSHSVDTEKPDAAQPAGDENAAQESEEDGESAEASEVSEKTDDAELPADAETPAETPEASEETDEAELPADVENSDSAVNDDNSGSENDTEVAESPEAAEIPTDDSEEEASDSAELQQVEDLPTIEDLKNEEEGSEESLKARATIMRGPLRAPADTNAGGEDPSTDDGSHDDWNFDIYFVNQNDPKTVYKSDDFSIKYQLEFNNSIDIEPFGAIIRVPASLIKYGHGPETEPRIEVLPSEIGVPEGSYDAENDEYEFTVVKRSYFNYYTEVDEKTGETYLVFFNYKKIEAATHNAIQILYRNYDVMEIEDETSWSVTPEVKVTLFKGTENEKEQTLTVTETANCKITVNINTRISLGSIYKRSYNGGKSYGPGLYTQKQLTKYAPNALSVKIPEQFLIEGNDGTTIGELFDEFRYVVWMVDYSAYANQPYNLIFQDWNPKSSDYYGAENKDSFIVGVYKAVRSGSERVGGEALEKTDYYDGNTPDYVSSYIIAEYSKERKRPVDDNDGYFFVVTAYPRDSIVPNETTLYNFTRIVMQPYDWKEEIQYSTSYANWTYHDYVWYYRGDIIGVDKDGGGILPGWTTVMHQIDGDQDLTTADFRVKGTCRSFYLTHDITTGSKTYGQYIPGRYTKVTTVDDVVYAYPQNGSKAGNTYMLTKDDYYFNTVTVRIADNGYDVYEDEPGQTTPVSETAGIDRDMHVFAMFAKDASGNAVTADEWEEVAVVKWAASGSLSYKFTDEQIAREPWRIKIEHNAVDYVTYSYINTNISIKGDSPAFADFKDADTVQIENLGGIMGEMYIDGNPYGYYQDQRTDSRYQEEGLLELTQDLYRDPKYTDDDGNPLDVILMRDNAWATLLGDTRYASASKAGSAKNDPVHSRANITYSLYAAEGYKVYSEEAINYIKSEGVDTPNRKSVVFYDLLPYGVQFDPSVEVVAGRLKTDDAVTKQPNYNAWDKSQVTVTVDPSTDVIVNYNNTGRTLIVFHIEYTGRDSTVYDAGESTYDNYWFTGFAVKFGAYCDYLDYHAAAERPNIVAYMPGTSEKVQEIIGREDQVSLDNGTVQTTDGFADYYADLGSDINQDGKTDTRNVLYAQSQVFDDIAIAVPAKLDKFVRADDDPFGVYKTSTSVLNGNGYEYKLTVSNLAITKLKNVIVFDRIENAAKDRQEQEPGAFDDKYWYGTFDGLVLKEIEEQLVTPELYYTNSENPVYPSEGQDYKEVFTESNGWFKGSVNSKGEFLLPSGLTKNTVTSSAAVILGNVNTYSGIVPEGLSLPNVVPVVYYSKSRDALFPVQGQDPYEVLTEENGWIKGSRDASGNYLLPDGWSNSDVLAFAVDMEGYVMPEEGAISFQVRMMSPKDMPEDGAVWAYNNPAFYSVSEGLGSGSDTTQWLEGNSVSIKLVESKGLEIEKSLADGVPEARQNDEFKFYLTWSNKKDDSNATEYPYAYRDYSLYEKNEDGTWRQIEGFFYTDADGALYLKAGQRAVFEDTDVDGVSVKEEEYLNWSLADEDLEGKMVGGFRHIDAVNIYHPILYVQKHVKGYSSTDAAAVNLEKFEMRLTDKDGNPVANKTLYVVKQPVTNGDEPIPVDNAEKKLYGNLGTKTGKLPDGVRVLSTDAGGVFTIYPEETVAIPLDEYGVEYTVTELEKYYTEDTNWICNTPSDTKELAAEGTVYEITNNWRWKELNITKTVSGAGYSDMSEYEFTFKIYSADENGNKGEQITDFKYQILDSASADADDDAWLSPAADGSITAACAGKVIRVYRFRAGVPIVIEEVISEELSEFFEAEADSINYTIPTYANYGRVEFINKYLYRDLEINKTLIVPDTGADSSSDTNPSSVEFTFVLESAKASTEDFAPAAGVEYVLINTETGEEIEGTAPLKTDENGQFKLADNQTARFISVGKEGDLWRVKELVDDTYKPLIPLELDENEEYTEWVSRILSDNNSITFVNGEGGTFIIRKNWTGDGDEAQDLIDKYGAPGSQYNIAPSGEITDPMEFSYTHYMSANFSPIYTVYNSETGQYDPRGFANVPVEVLSSHNANIGYTSYGYRIKAKDGNGNVILDSNGNAVTTYTWLSVPGNISLYGNDAYVIFKIHREAEDCEWYDLSSETFEFYEGQQGLSQFPSASWSFPGFGEYEGSIVVVNPGEGTRKIEITPNESPLHVAENVLKVYKSGVQKRVVGNYVWGEKDLVWRVEKYENGAWNPAAGVSYSSQSIYNNGYSFQMVEDGIKPLEGTTGKDGKITITSDKFRSQANFGDSGIYSNMAYILFDQKVYVGITSAQAQALIDRGEETVVYRVVELADESDEAWGYQAAYTTGKLGYTSNPFAGEFIYESDYTRATGFVNSNIYAYLTIRKIVDEPTDQEFSFRIQQYESLVGEDLIDGGGLKYFVYDIETLESVETDEDGNDKAFYTDSTGRFTLRGGQAAVIRVVPRSRWLITEDNALPYRLESVESTGLEAYERGNGMEVSLVGNVEDYLRSDVIRKDFSVGIGNLASRMGLNTYYTWNGSRAVYLPYNLNNIVFGKASDYQDVVSNSMYYEVMDANGLGTIKGYLYSPQGNGRYTFYVLSDNLMYMNPDSSRMFSSLVGNSNYYNYLNNITFDNISSAKVKNLNYTFANLTNLTIPDLSWMDTSSVQSMIFTFSGLPQISSLDFVKNFDTSNVKYTIGTFSGCNNLNDVSAISKWDTGNVVNMASMFNYCNISDTTPLSGWDTSNVVNTSYMFYHNIPLHIDGLSSWDTSSLVDTSYMFGECYGMTDLSPISKWDMSNVQNMAGMFYQCYSIRNVDDLAKWDVSSVVNMSSTFAYCNGMDNVSGLADWDVSGVVNMSRTFSDCYSLRDITGLANWDVSSVENMSGTFSSCYGFTDNIEPLSKWNTSSVKDMSYTFSSCYNLKDISPLANWDVSQVETLYSTFSQCYGFTDNLEPLSKWNTSSVKDMSYTFSNCYNLKDVSALADWDVSSAETMDSTFRCCYSLLDAEPLKNWNVSNVATMDYMFFQNYNLANVPKLSAWNTSKVESMSYMFYQCYSIYSIDELGSWNVSSVKCMYDMFGECNNLTSVDLSAWSVSSVEDLQYMFASCSNLSSFKANGWNTTSLKSSAYMFNNCGNLTTLELAEWDISSITGGGNHSKTAYTHYLNGLQSMFSGCNSLEVLDLSSWKTSGVTDLSYMFNGCSSLKELNLSNWDTSSVINMSYMFQYCSSLVMLDLRGWDTSSVTSMYYMFYNDYNLEHIYVSEEWTTSNVSSYYGMFTYDSKLPHFLSNTTDKTRAYAGGVGYLEYIGDLIVQSNDESLGTVSGSFTNQSHGIISATPAEGMYFIGWYHDDTRISRTSEYDCYIGPDQQPYVVEGRFSSEAPRSEVIVTLSPGVTSYGWTTSSYSNPAGSDYNMYMSTNYHRSNTYSVMKVTLSGMDSYTFYINSYAESSYDYTYVTSLDPASYNSVNIASTSSYQYNPSNYPYGWRTVTINLPDSEEHYFYIVYRKDGSADNNYDRGFVLLPDVTEVN